MQESTTLKELIEKVIAFRDNRDWEQYHNPKDLAVSLSLEASELLELFQWKDAEEVEGTKSDEKIRQRIKEELGDIFVYALTLCHTYDFDPSEVVLEKLKLNDKKYPVEKVKGKADKYTEY